MTLAEKLGYYLRFTSGLQEYLRTPLPADIEHLIRDQMANRATNWLSTLRQAVYTDPENPFHRMLQKAGCAYPDLEAGVHNKGLEATLYELRRSGVYLTQEELKARRPIVRSGEEIPSRPDSFHNPLAKGWFAQSSSGRSGDGTETRNSTPHMIHRTAYASLGVREFALKDRAFVALRPILPAGGGISAVLFQARLGCRVERWFAHGGRETDSLHYRTLTNYLVAVARWHGVKAPFPTHLPSDDFAPAARWIAARKKEGIACAVEAFVSPAVRAAAAALENDLDIAGTLFIVGGEALTEAKRRTMESTGSRVFARYGMTEFGDVARACHAMTSGNALHLLRDSIAAITDSGPPDPARSQSGRLFYTTLLPVAPRILINLESGDTGFLEPTDCDCVYSKAGFTQQVRDVGSYGKLTSQGVTLMGCDVARIVESELPSRFGGSPGDYQLIEWEGPRQTELELRVSPRVPLDSPDLVRDCFLREIRKLHGGALASRCWRDTNALRVVRLEPSATFSGKVLPLKRSTAQRPAP